MDVIKQIQTGTFNAEQVLKFHYSVHFPDEVYLLTNLEELKINSKIVSDTKLNMVMSEKICTLTKLKILCFTHHSTTKIPNSIANLTNLQILDLSNGNLTELCNEISALVNLQKLDLSNNNLTTLCDEISGLVNLEILYLGHNNLTTLYFL